MHMYLCNVDEYFTVPYSEILPIGKAYKILIFRSIFFFETIELSATGSKLTNFLYLLWFDR